jgi:hypothetical protein
LNKVMSAAVKMEPPAAAGWEPFRPPDGAATVSPGWTDIKCDHVMNTVFLGGETR